MGPRSDERGKAVLKNKVINHAIASMGPRSDERGKIYVLGTDTDFPISFNGAAFG